MSVLQEFNFKGDLDLNTKSKRKLYSGIKKTCPKDGQVSTKPKLQYKTKTPEISLLRHFCHLLLLVYTYLAYIRQGRFR